MSGGVNCWSFSNFPGGFDVPWRDKELVDVEFGSNGSRLDGMLGLVGGVKSKSDLDGGVELSRMSFLSLN